jgi:hypothetical protein
MRTLPILVIALSAAACTTEAPPLEANVSLRWALPDASGRIQCPDHLFSSEVDTIEVEVWMGDYSSETMFPCSQGSAVIPVPAGTGHVSVAGLDYHSLSDTYEQLTLHDFEIDAVAGQEIDLGFVSVVPRAPSN